VTQYIGLKVPKFRHYATCATPYRGAQVVVAHGPGYWSHHGSPAARSVDRPPHVGDAKASGVSNGTHGIANPWTC
jgi:hypothetical protein